MVLDPERLDRVSMKTSIEQVNPQEFQRIWGIEVSLGCRETSPVDLAPLIDQVSELSQLHLPQGQLSPTPTPFSRRPQTFILRSLGSFGSSKLGRGLHEGNSRAKLVENRFRQLGKRHHCLLSAITT